MMTTGASKGMHTAYIALGANLGDRVAGCMRGVDLLTGTGEITLVKHSRYYYSAPVDYTDQPWFVNAVFQAVTDLDPVMLLRRLKKAESAAGRQQAEVRFGPRVLDLDLILYDDAVINTPDLIVPHPRMNQRAFVLMPLCDIAPDLVHPVVGLTVSELLADTVVASQQCFAVNNKGIDKKASA